MRLRRNLAVALTATLLMVSLIGLHVPKTAATAATYYVSAEPTRIPGEGLNTNITFGMHGGSANTTYMFEINVTDPANTSYTTYLPVTTNGTGSGENVTEYYGNFLGAHTNYTGVYSVKVNQTMANTTFTVGLTDATRYKRSQTVYIRGANYTQPNEHVWVNITSSGETLYSENVTAINGVVEANWTIPMDAPLGNYTVTLTNITSPGTLKPVNDTQEFKVTGIISLEPESGSVGSEVRVTGEIDTENGSFKIFFHDGIQEVSVKTGTADGFLVNETFWVRPSMGGDRYVKLNDPAANTNATETFTVETSYHVEADPDWIQEGLNTTIKPGALGAEANTTYTFMISVTDPTGASQIANLTFTTDEFGRYPGYILYPGLCFGVINYSGEFEDAGTDIVGIYYITVNETLVTGNFTVGLTDKLEYQAGETVSIRGSGYQANETVTVDLKFGGESVVGYPKNLTASPGGVVTDSWEVLIDATPGTYTVTLINATTPGTVKEPVNDTQKFEVLGVSCDLQVWNLDNETVAGVTVEAYNATTWESIVNGTTDETGRIRFLLDAGNYSFKAFWNDTQVGGLLKFIPEDVASIAENITLSLAHIRIAVKDDFDTSVSFANVTASYNYTARQNQTVSASETLEADKEGEVYFENMLTNVSYLLEAKRYGYLLNETLIENLTASLKVNITCPTYVLSVNVLDSKGLPLQNVQVAVYEWSTVISLRPPKATDEAGSTFFNVTPGIYPLRVYNDTAELGTVVLNQTVVNIPENGTSVTVYCSIFNLDLSIRVVDYFGRPLPGAEVEVKREDIKIGSDLKTGSTGIVSLQGVIGGDYVISVRVRNRLVGTKSLRLDKSGEVLFKIDGYAAVGGYPMEIAQLVTLISVSLLVALLGIIWAYRKRSPKVTGVKKPPKETG